MDILRRFDDKYLALKAGRRLDRIFPRDMMTGLNFFAEVGGPVVIVACFERDLLEAEIEMIDQNMDPGEELTPTTAEEYLEQLTGGGVGFMGDGLPAFETWVQEGSLRGGSLWDC